MSIGDDPVLAGKLWVLVMLSMTSGASHHSHQDSVNLLSFFIRSDGGAAALSNARHNSARRAAMHIAHQDFIKTGIARQN
jgi:hypothetical protein